MGMDRTAYRLISIRTKLRKKLAEVDNLLDQMDTVLAAETGGKLENFKPSKALAAAKGKVGGRGHVDRPKAGAKAVSKAATAGKGSAKGGTKPAGKKAVSEPIRGGKAQAKPASKKQAPRKPKAVPQPAAEAPVDPLS